MKLFRPTKYYKNILDINYQLLLTEGIKYLIFDLDNTLIKVDEECMNEKYISKLKELSKQFTILIITNAPKKKLDKYLFEAINDYHYYSIKPFKRAFKKLQKKHQFNNSECIMIGDQLLTDILFANFCHIRSILVDPISTKDLKITSLNRKIEKYLINKYQILERGKYNE